MDKTTYHSNGSIKFDKDSNNIFHENGAVAFDKSSGNVYHPDGSIAFDRSTGIAYHENGKIAYNQSSNAYLDALGNDIKNANSFGISKGVVIQIQPVFNIFVYLTAIK